MNMLAAIGATQDAPMTQDELLGFTQMMRKKLIDAITKHGEQMPDDPKLQYVLLTALTDIDRQAVNLKKIGAQERANEADRLAAAAITAMLNKLGGRHPFEQNIIDVEIEEAPAPALDADGLPPLELAPGETDIGIESRNFEQFMAEMEPGKK